MPQMSPSMWLIIMLTSIIIYLMLMLKLYYINLKLKIKKNKMKSNFIKKMFKFKW